MDRHQPGVRLRDVAILALEPFERGPDFSAWSAQSMALVRSEAARLLDRQDHAAAFLQPEAENLVRGIELASFVGPGAPFGPAWSCHPFLSPAMAVGYKLREADLTRELALLMGRGAGSRGPERARSFLRALSEAAARPALAEAIGDEVMPIVTAEHPVTMRRGEQRSVDPRLDAPVPPSKRASIPRIDLLFEWPIGGNRLAVVVVEAKIGASVSDGQLSPYRTEAVWRARGGPVTAILLTIRADKAERRHRAWSAARWPALMRRWEPMIALTGDDDPEFARVRAHIWRFVLQHRGGHVR